MKLVLIEDIVVFPHYQKKKKTIKNQNQKHLNIYKRSKTSQQCMEI